LSAIRIADCTGLSKYKHFFKNNGKTLNKGLFDNKNLCSKDTIIIKSSFLNTNFYKHLSATPKNASYIINVCLDTVHTPFKKNNSTKRSLVELNESKDLNKSLTAGYYNSTPVDEEKRLYQKYNTTLFPINEDSDRILKQNFGKQSALAFLKLPINNIDFSAKKGFLFKLRNGVVSDITERNVIKVPYFVFKQVRYKRKR